MLAGEWNVLGRPNNKTVGPVGVLKGDDGLPSPTAIDGLALWLDAIDQNSLLASNGSVVADGGEVALVSDKSGNSTENCLVLNGAAGNYGSFTALTAFGTGDFSVSGRISVPTIGTRFRFFGGATNAFNFGVNGAGNDGKLRAGKVNITDLTPSTGTIAAFTDVVIGYTRSGTTGTYYIDGVAAGTITDNQDYSVGLSNLGASINGSSDPAQGIMSWARFYSTALTAPQMLADAAGTQQANCVFDVDFRNSAKLATSATDSVGSKTVTINSTGATGARISGARDPYQGTVANRPVYLKYNGENYGYLNGVAGNYFRTPDSAAVSLTGDIEIIVKAAHANWLTGAGFRTMVAKYLVTGDQRSYRLGLLPNNANLQFQISTSGAAAGVVTYQSTAAVSFAALAIGWVRVTLDVDNGSSQSVAKFYTSTDGVAWTQLGTDVTEAVVSIYDSTALLQVGETPTVSADTMTGRVYVARVYDGIGGALVADFDASRYTSGTTFTASTGETWTLNGGAEIVTNTCIYGDGVNDAIKTAAYAQEQPVTLYWIGSMSSWTASDYLVDGAATNSGAIVQTTSTPQVNLNAGSSVAANTDAPLKTWGVFSAVINGANSTLRWKRLTATTGDAGAADMNGTTLLARGAMDAGWFNGSLGEYIQYSGAHSVSTQDRLILYAARKRRFSV